ncbi:MAG: MBL fold metallo-hydrolase [Candidatus Hydrogenedens sp.]|nr:MBL fold metallo-hydrolase [Candidatus Hydrogenedens sp.]
MTMLRLCSIASILFAITACSSPPPAIPETAEIPPDLAAFRDEFRQGVEKVADGVYVAIGFGLANSVMLEGDNGVIIVDTLESRPRAEAAFAAFREVTDKPVKAVILTHNHADHVFGGLVFTGGDPDIPVYAHESLDSYVDRIVSVLKDAIYVRSMRMFGQMLPESAATAAGIGMSLDFKMEDIALARPTQTFSDTLDLEIEGIRLQLIHTPGETPDQIAVWLPDQKVLIPADNFYKAFPNLYTIRGTAYRDVMEWVRSLDAMRDLEPEYLVPCHTRPIAGREAILDALTNYRDAIQIVHDQTIRGLNKGRTPDELAAEIHLPPHLATNPYLQPVYGNVPFSVRGICDGYLGWFGGDAVALDPLPPAEESHRMLEAFASGIPLPEQARNALDNKEYRWAAELARHWVRNQPENADARNALADALEGLGMASVNFNAKNYYLTQAMEWRGELEITPGDPSAAPDSLIESLPIDRFMQAMTVRLKAEETLDVDQVALFRFTDVGKDYTMHIRRGVAETRQRTAENPDITITTTAHDWKRIASRKDNPAMAYATGALQVEGGVTAVMGFMGYFER